MSFESREHLYGYLFVVPALLFMLAFVGYPIVYNIVLSLQDVNVMTFSQETKDFVGVANYQKLFQGEMIYITLKNTIIYTLGSIAFQFVIGFALALFFTRQFPMSGPIRGLLVITWMMPMTVTALLYKFMLSPTNGILDEILRTLHLIDKPVGWLIHVNTALWGVILANIWVGVPFNMILLSTGLANIPDELYESASIDGANAGQRFAYMTLPLLRPAILSVLILGVIYTFKVFDLVFVMTGGGPVNATEVLSTYAYRQSFSEFNFSTGAAIANVLFLCLFVVGLGYIKTIKPEEVMS